MRRTRRLGGKVPAHTPRDQLLEAGPAALPLLPEEAAKAAANPLIKTLKYTRRFTETEIAAPARQVSFQRTDQLVSADPSRALGQFPDSCLEAG